MAIEFKVIQSRPQTHKVSITTRGGVVSVRAKFPPRPVICVKPPHTIFNLARQLKKNKRDEIIYAKRISQEIKLGNMKVEDGQVMKLDKFGVLPPQKVKVTDRVVQFLTKIFGK